MSLFCLVQKANYTSEILNYFAYYLHPGSPSKEPNYNQGVSMKTHRSNKKIMLFALTILMSVASGLSEAANPYEWNKTVPVKTPNNPNGKTVLFDVSHGGTEGNADWVIDGAFSDFADALVNNGYRVEEYRGVDLSGDGKIRFYDDLNRPENTNLNEAIITYEAIKHADVFVMAETNRPLTTDEYKALERFVAAGKGIYFIADHYNADRNLNTWDATEVFNGYNRSTLSKYNYGGAYGDLRNPGNQNGWLAKNFGLRFRFNAVDYKTGVSGIISPAKSENITQGVSPILMAAGSTLSIIDPQKAKGLIYFSDSDKPVKWKYAPDAGLYYGGKAEGAYVAIAKSGAGKAAFIGDSSPIEDRTSKYRRQDNGKVKKTYPGWTDRGNAAKLSINIINWLATPESYSNFNDTNGHASGFVTPNAKALTEMDDPDNGQPWSQPKGGYNPWNTDTFAKGSFGAKYPLGNHNDGGDQDGGNQGGGHNKTLDVEAALAIKNGSKVIVEGIVTAAANGQYALILTDDNNVSQSIIVKLERKQRGKFSPQRNRNILNHRIRVEGLRSKYMSRPGIRNVTKITDLGSGHNSGGSHHILDVEAALMISNGKEVTVEGLVTASQNGKYALILTDDNNRNKSINVKLERNQRQQFSPVLNPNILNHRIRVTGTRNNYLSQPGIREVSNITKLSSDNQSGGGNSDQYISVNDALNASKNKSLTVIGVVTQEVNGRYGLLLKDLNSNATINVKLKRSLRQQFNPQLNPSILGKTLIISGKRHSYMGQPGIRYIKRIQIKN